MNVAIRVDASSEIGTGHFMRCLSLADSLHEQGATLRVVSRQLPEHLRRMVEDRAIALAPIDGGPPAVESGLAHARWLGTTQAADAEQTAAALDGRSWDWVIVDHYALDARWESAMRARAARVLVIDDLADRQHECDALLDQNLYSDMEQRYAGKVPAGSRMLLGPRYALLRPEFPANRRRVTSRSGPVARALIAFGGVDRQNLTTLAMEALVASGVGVPSVDVVIGATHASREQIEAWCRQHRFRCHVQTHRMAELMAAADLAIGAGGVMTWERCCMGVPALALPVAANQQQAVSEAARRGLLYTPVEGPVTVASLARHIAALIDSPSLREMMSGNGMDTVDGHGAARVASALDEDPIRVREATLDDAPALFEWRNHESVRKFARHSDPITPGEHEAWLRTALSNPNRVLLIGERNGHAAGVVRFDIAGNQAEVSIYRVPDAPGGGLGAPLLRAAEAWLRVRRPDVASLTAEVLGDNERSHHLFSAGGYQRCSTAYQKQLRS